MTSTDIEESKAKAVTRETIKHDAALAIRKILDDAAEQYEAAWGNDWDEDDVLQLVTEDP